MLRIFATAVMALSALLAPMPAAAQTPSQPPLVAVTRHIGHFQGQTVPYTATVRQHILNDAHGVPAASIITTAYVRADVAEPAKRPVMFLFNGGPGAASAPLHIGALGPMRWVKGQPQPWGENPGSPLDVVDLVFIDPVGTGYARVFPGADTKAWYSRTGDALAVKSVISDWLKANHREASPRYLAGESYGTVRAALIVGAGLRFDGVLLIALVGQAPGNEMPYVTSLPSMAAAAWYHRRAGRADQTAADVYNEAVQFARTEYVSALIQGSSLPQVERRRIAARMAQLIGLPAELIEQNNLRISKPVFMFNLLRDRALRTGMLDTRVTAPLAPGQVGDLDDPALGVVPQAAPGAAPAPPPNPASIGPISSSRMAGYFNQFLNYPDQNPYYTINFSANAVWDEEGEGDVMAHIGAAMTADPHMRLFWAAGYYDLSTPAYEARYTLDQDGIPAAQLTPAYFTGPHGVYEGEENLARFIRAVRAFILETPAAR